jgi:hypothetical protein
MPETERPLCQRNCLKPWVLLAGAAWCLLSQLSTGAIFAQDGQDVRLNDDRDTSRRVSKVDPPAPTLFADQSRPDNRAEDGEDDDLQSRSDREFDSDDTKLAELEDESQDEGEDATEPASASIELGTISTTTRGLKVNILETHADVPEDQSYRLARQAGIHSSPVASEKLFAWAAPNIRYQRLYFEDVPLERYGQTPCGLRQTILSGAHFYKSAILLPYQAISHPPKDCDWPLGFCRPGAETPFVWERHLKND